MQLTYSDYQGNLTAPFAAIVGGFFIMEIWKPIKDYESLYEISNLGRVKSLSRIGFKKGNEFKIKEKILKPIDLGKHGYKQVNLCKENIKTKFLIHRLVAAVFLEKKEYQSQVNHKNKITSDNRLDNLEWVSSRENHCHRRITKDCSSKYIGVRHIKNSKNWRSQIDFDGKKIHLGMFKTEIEAYVARLNFELNNNITNKYL